MASVNQTRPHYVNQVGKTQFKRLAARHGRGTAWAWHGHGTLCVNRALMVQYCANNETCGFSVTFRMLAAGHSHNAY